MRYVIIGCLCNLCNFFSKFHCAYLLSLILTVTCTFCVALWCFLFSCCSFILFNSKFLLENFAQVKPRALWLFHLLYYYSFLVGYASFYYLLLPLICVILCFCIISCVLLHVLLSTLALQCLCLVFSLSCLIISLFQSLIF